MSSVTFQVNMDDLDPDLEGWFEDALKEAEVRIQQRTPRRTGTLADSIAVNKTSEGGFEIASDVEYFPYVEFGTSKMAGHYMVRTTLEELPQILDRTEVKWKK